MPGAIVMQEEKERLGEVAINVVSPKPWRQVPVSTRTHEDANRSLL
jgi:hypothetical protein